MSNHHLEPIAFIRRHVAFGPASVGKVEVVGDKQAQKGSSGEWMHENWQNSLQSSTENTGQVYIHVKRKCKEHEI